MSHDVRIGVIGTGPWGKNLLRNFQALGALGALCDIDHDAREWATGSYPEVTAYATAADLLADPAVDAVAVATPPVTHADLILQALDAGKHVFVEKPLCLHLEEADRVRTRALGSGLCLMVGHLLLYHPAFVALQEAVREGRLGMLRYIYCNRLSLGKIRREENSLWSFAPHDISMILNLTGRMPREVITSGGTYLSATVADTTLSHLSFEDGMQAHIFVSWLHPYKDHRMVVVGLDGMIVFNDVSDGAEKLLYYPHEAKWKGDLPVVNKAAPEPLAYDDTEPLALECAHFLSCLAEGKTPLSDVEEGRRVLAVLDACQRSLNTGQPVTLDGALEI
jgi:UDP-2-acetamido-3-amino-2,3-dideoxy-glucuronate N-acetyltransferase